ncbi:hypothetical protein [Streptomyces sp. NEAU-174]|uniref:hypothetical protein n=1 Tax=Streptomyces sp. NEAU-174 TaxID=3458254 RepID=UPI0040448551
MTSTGQSDRNKLKDYGPQQFPDRLGFELWRFERALAKGLIPRADVDGRRWSAAIVEDALARVEEIRSSTGSLPDMGATRAAAILEKRFTTTVDPNAERDDRTEPLRADHIRRRLQGQCPLRWRGFGTLRRPGST